MDRRSLEPGLMLFIKRKLESGVPLPEVTDMLLRAGFNDREVREAIRGVKRKFKDVHQDIVAANGFLPPLREKTSTRKTESIRARPSKEIVLSKKVKHTGAHKHKHLALFKGRLRRRDFIYVFLFYFGLAVVLLSAVFNILAVALPRLAAVVNRLMDNSESGLVLLLIPAIMAPITFILISVIGRRLHDLGLPAWISFGYLVFFINPMGDIFSTIGIIALQAVLAVIFIILVAHRGDMGENKYGSKPSMRGSLFSRVFNIIE